MNGADPPDLSALSGWAPELARTFVSLASDIALVIDDTGVIRDVAQGQAEPIAQAADRWVGRPWIDTVSNDTRGKIENLLKEVASTGIARRREVNHPLGGDNSIPVAYTAIRLGERGPVLAVGRDLRTIAAIQQRYVESQQELERGYWQVRQAEARYQLLFQVATDAVLVVDAESLQIVEANQAATKLLGADSPGLACRPFASGFEHHSRPAVNELMVSARATGRGGEIRARLLGTQTSVAVVATPFRTDDTLRLLVRVRAFAPAVSPSGLSQTLSRLVDDATDGVVVTDSSGRILVANPAFLAIVRLDSESQARGQPIMNWMVLADQPLALLVATVRRDGIARGVATLERQAMSHVRDVDVSAALLTEGDQECIGFIIRPVAAAPEVSATDSAQLDELARELHASVESLQAQLADRGLGGMAEEARVLAARLMSGLAPQDAPLLAGPGAAMSGPQGIGSGAP